MSLNSGETLLMQRRKRKFHVVIVQGIGEDSKGRDTGKEVMWLNEFLLKRYGATHITNFANTLDIGAGILFTGIREAAVQLLVKVQKEMGKNKAPSLLLIGYDLGGLIIKQALLIAINNEDYSSIAEKTSLLVFIGTPHRVTEFETWESISIKLMLRRRPGGAYTFSKVLEQSAQTLMEVSENFQTVARIYRIVNFYEDVNNTSSQTSLGFSKDTSTMGVSEEACVPMDNDPIVDEDLKEDEERGKFVDLLAKLMWRTKEIEELYLSCIRTLSMVDCEHRLGGVQPFASNPESFNWILDRDAYKNWSGPSCRLLWLHGRAESDVAVSLCFLQSKACETFPDANIVKFSFDSRDDRYRSTYRMLACLSRQLLILQPALFNHVMPLYEKISHEMPWRIDRLWAFFRSLLACPHDDHGVTFCFVNMIDECDPSRNQFLYDLLLLPETSTGAFRLAITSHKAPDSDSTFTADVINVDPRRDEDPEEMRRELEEVIARKVYSLFQARPELAKFDFIIKEKLRASADVFTTSLTIALLQARQPQSTYAELETELSSLPHTTIGLYQHFLDKTPTERRPWSSKVLTWIIHASRPLKLTELAIALALQADVSSIYELQNRLPQDLALDLQQVFGNLITIEQENMLFVHSCFRDFLLQDRPCPQEGTWIFNLDDHAALAESCLHYLSLVAAKRRQSNSEDDRDDADRLPKGVEYDFLNYAVQYWPKHYNSAKHEVHPGLHERACAFLEDPRFIQVWSSLHWTMGNLLERPQMSFKNPLPLVVRLRCSNIVHTLLKKPDLDREDLPTALEVAIENGDETIIDYLRAAGAKSTMELHKAALYGQDKVMCQILKEGPETNTVSRGSTPLHFASTSGYHKLVRRLLKAKFNPNAKDEQDLAPLHLASQFGHVSVIEELLVRKVSAGINVKTDVNMEADGLTNTGSETDVATNVNPHSKAEFEADTRTVTVVETDANVDAYADVNILDDSRWTPLHMATRWQQPGAVIKLLGRGANIDATDAFDNTALHLAAKSGREDVVGILLSHYEALQKNPSGSEDLQNAMQSQDSRNSTPLHLAAGEGHTGVVQQLLGKLEASNSFQATMMVDSSGNTPLHLAAENGHAGVVEALIERDTRSVKVGRARRHAHESSILITNQRSQAPIHLAVLSGDASVVTKLCAEHRRQKAPLDLFDDETQSPLHLASCDGLADIVGILLEHGARADIADENAKTPLLLGCTIGHLEIVKQLLTHGANLMCANSQGRSALHQATAVGALGVVQELLRASRKLINGRDYVNLRDNDGSTPLHLAAEAGNVQVMEELLNEKADVKAVDGNGDSVLYLASERGHIKMVRFLIRKIKEDIEGADGESSPSGWGLLEVARALLLKTPDDRTETEKTNNPDVPDSQEHSREILTALLGVPDRRWDSAQYGSILRLAAQKGITSVVVQTLGVEGVEINDVDDEEKTALLLAAQNGRSPVVEELLKVPNIDRDRQDDDGRSAISYAAESGHMEIVKSLASGRKSAMKFETYNDALGYAAAAGHINIVTFFLDNVTSTQPDDAERSPLDNSLRRAISGEHDQLVSLLVARDANVNTTDRWASTPLHLAAKLGNTKICEILLESRKISDINARDYEGRTTLFLAAWHKNLEVVKLLLKFHADIEAPEQEGWRPLHAAYDSIPITQILLEAGAKVDSITQKKETPLFVAIERGYEDVSKKLLGYGADPLAATDTGRTPLHEAAVASDDFFRLLLERTDKLKKSADPRDAKKRSPLSIAAARGRAGLVKTLLDRKDVEINQKDDEGKTPLWCAITGGHDEVVELLLKSPKLNVRGSSKAPEDLLRHAAQHESRRILTLLLDKDIPVHCGDDVLLEIAMETENARLIELVLDKGLDGRKLDQHGWSLRWMKYISLPPGDERANQPEISGTAFLPPTRWSEIDKTGLLRVEDDGLTASYRPKFKELLRRRMGFYNYSRISSHRLSSSQTGLVRADHPIPPVGKFKFEIEILDAGQTGIIGIGFGHKAAPLENTMPGWDPFTWGYHGDDGKKFQGRGRGIDYAERYGKGAVIGCHIDQSKGIASFTRNGKDLGTAFQGIRGRLYPMMGVRSPGSRVVTRFSWSGIDGDKGPESLALAPPDNSDEVESIPPEDEYSDSGSSP